MNIQSMISYEQSPLKDGIIALFVVCVLITGLIMGLNRWVTSVPTQVDSVATVVLPNEKALPPFDILSAEIRPEWGGLTADEIIGKYKKGQVRREFPKQYLDEPIEAIDEAAKSGDRAAQKAMKLLTNKRFDKDDNRK